MSIPGGLTIELNNYQAFKKELGTLTSVIRNINNAIDLTSAGFDKFEAATGKVLKSLREDLKAMDKEAMLGGESIGAAVILGIEKGLKDSDSKTAITGATKFIVQQIMDGIKNPLEIRSPSGWGQKIGQYIIQGISKGLEGGQSLLSGAMSKVTSFIKSIFGGAGGSVSNTQLLEPKVVSSLGNVIDALNKMAPDAAKLKASGLDDIRFVVIKLQAVLSSVMTAAKVLSKNSVDDLSKVSTSLQHVMKFLRQFTEFVAKLPASTSIPPVEPIVHAIRDFEPLLKYINDVAKRTLQEDSVNALSRAALGLIRVKNFLYDFAAFTKAANDKASIFTLTSFGAIKKQIQDVEPLFRLIGRLADSFPKDDATNIRKFSQGIKDIFKFVNDFSNAVEKDTTDPSSSKNLKSILANLKYLPDLTKIISDSLFSFTKFPIKDTSKFVHALNDGLLGFLKGYADFVDKSRSITTRLKNFANFNRIFTPITANLLGIKRVAQIIGTAIGSFGFDSNLLNARADFMKSLTSLFDFISDYSGFIDKRVGIWNRVKSLFTLNIDRTLAPIKNSLLGLRSLMLIVAQAMSAFAAYKLPTEGMADFFKSLTSLQTFIEGYSKFITPLSSGWKNIAKPIVSLGLLRPVQDSLYGLKGLAQTVASAVAEIAKVDNLDNTSGVLRQLERLFNFINEFGGLVNIRFSPNQFLSNVLHDWGALVSPMKSLMRGLKPITKIMAEALGSFEKVRNPEALNHIFPFLNSLISFINQFADLSLGSRNWNSFFNNVLNLRLSDMVAPVSSLLKGLKPLTKIIAESLSNFDSIPDGANVKRAIEALQIVVDIIPKLAGLQNLSKGGIVNFVMNSGLAATVKGIGPLFKTIADALQPISQLKFNADPTSIASLLNNIETFIVAINKVLPHLVHSKFFGLTTGVDKQFKGIVKVFGVIANAVNQFSSIQIDPNKMNSIAGGLKAFTAAIGEFTKKSNVSLGVANTDISKNIVEIAQNIAKALDVLGGVSNAANALKASESVNKLANALNKLGNLVTVSRIASELGDELPKIMLAIQQGFNQGKLATMGKESGESFGKGFTKEVKSELEVASPSRFMRRMADFAVQGFTQGINGGLGAVKNSALNFISTFKQQILQGVSQIGQSLTQMGQQAFQGGKTALITGGIVGLITGSQIGMAADFDQVLTQIQTFGNVSQQAISGVRDEILKFSADTIFNPQDSAAAFLDLQKAGLSVSDSMLALTRVGELATAANMSLSDSMNAVISASKSFGIPMSEAIRITDGYVRAANLGTAEAIDLSQGLANIGPAAAQFGLGFEQTLAILSMFNDQGIRGAEAGTQLKSMLLSLTKPTKEVEGTFKELGVSLVDAGGNFRSLNDIINDLDKAMNETKIVTREIVTGIGAEQRSQLELAEKAFTAADRKIQMFEMGLSSASEKTVNRQREIRANAEAIMGSIAGGEQVVGRITQEIRRSQEDNFRSIQALAGSYGQAGLTILLSQDQDAIDNFVKEMDKGRSAAEISKKMMESFKGAIESLRGSLDTLRIKSLTPLMNYALKPLVTVGISVVNALSELPEPILAIASGLVLAGAAATTLVGVGLILVSTVLVPLGIAFSAVAAGIGAVTFMITNPVGLVMGMLSLGVGVAGLVAGFGFLVGSMAAITVAIGTFIDSARKNEEVVQGFNDLKAAIEALFGNVKSAVSAWGDLVSQFSMVQDGSNRTTQAFQPLADFLDRLKDKVNAVAGGFKDLATFINLLSDVNVVRTGSDPTKEEDLRAELAALDQEIADRERHRQEAIRRGEEFTEGSTSRTTQRTTRVGRGDTLWGISQREGIDLDQLMAMNPGLNPKLLQIGQDIILQHEEIVSQSDELLNRRKEISDQIVDEMDRERQLRRQYELEGETYLEPQERRLNSLQKRIDAFAKTPLGKRIFGTFKVDVNAFINRLNDVDKTFKNMGRNIDVFKQGIANIFTGESEVGIKRVGLGVQRLAGNITDLIEQTTGLDVNDRLQDALKNMSSPEAIEFFKSEAIRLGKDLLRAVTPAIASLIGGLAELSTRAFLGLPRLLIEGLLGMDVSPAFSAFADKVGQGFKNAVKEISSVFTGDKTLGGAIKGWLNSMGVDTSEDSPLGRLATFLAEQGDAIKLAMQSVKEAFTGPDAKSTITGMAVVGGVIALFFATPMLATAGAGLLTVAGGFLFLRGAISLIDPLMETFRGIGDIFNGLKDGNLDQVGRGLASIASGLLRMIPAFIGGVGDGLADIFRLLGMDSFADKVQLISDLFSAIGSEEGMNVILGGFVNRLTDLGKVLGDTLPIIFQNFLFLLESLPLRAEKAVKDLINSLVSNVPPELLAQLGIEGNLIDTSGVEERIADLENRRLEFNMDATVKAKIDNIEVDPYAAPELLAMAQENPAVKQMIIDYISEAANISPDDPAFEETRQRLATLYSAIMRPAGNIEDVDVEGMDLSTAVDAVINQSIAGEPSEEAKAQLNTTIAGLIAQGISPTEIQSYLQENVVNESSINLINEIAGSLLSGDPTEAVNTAALNMLDGLVGSITSEDSVAKLTDAATAVKDSWMSGLDTAMESHSPSQLMFRYADEIIIQGLIDGLNSGASRITPVIQGIGNRFNELVTAMQKFKVASQTEMAAAAGAIQSNGFVIRGELDLIANAAWNIYSNASMAIGALTSLSGMNVSTGGSGGSAPKPPQQALGGRTFPGMPTEILESRKNVPFEIWESRGRKYFLSNEPGYMHSPLSGDARGSGGGGVTYIDQSTTPIYITEPGASLSDIQRVVKTTMREERENNPASLKFKRAGY